MTVRYNGAPVVGFGVGEVTDGTRMVEAVGIPVLGIIAGAVGGAALGKGVIGTASGAVIGGLVGGAGGILIAESILHAQVMK